MTTATQNQTEILEALSQMNPADICKLVAIAARKNQKQLDKLAAKYDRESYSQEDDEEEIEYQRLQDLAEDTWQEANKWEELADTMKGLSRDLK